MMALQSILNSKRAFSLVLVVLVVSSAGLAAAVESSTMSASFDGDASDVYDGATVILQPANDSASFHVEATSASEANATFVIRHSSHDNITFYETDLDRTLDNGTYIYTADVNHSELADLPRTRQGALTTAAVYDSEGKEMTNASVTFSPKSGTTFEPVIMVASLASEDNGVSEGDGYLADELALSERTGVFGVLGGIDIPYIGSEEAASTEYDIADIDDEVSINATGDDITYVVHDADTEAVLDNLVADKEAGETVHASAVMLDTQPVALYVEEAPDSVEDGAAYTTYNADTNRFVIETGDEFEGDEQVNVNAVAGEPFGFWVAQDNFGFGYAGKTLASNFGL